MTKTINSNNDDDSDDSFYGRTGRGAGRMKVEVRGHKIDKVSKGNKKEPQEKNCEFLSSIATSDFATFASPFFSSIFTHRAQHEERSPQSRCIWEPCSLPKS